MMAVGKEATTSSPWVLLSRIGESSNNGLRVAFVCFTWQKARIIDGVVSPLGFAGNSLTSGGAPWQQNGEEWECESNNPKRCLAPPIIRETTGRIREAFRID